MRVPERVPVIEREGVPDRFVLRYHYQETWHLWHALWFCTMGLGAALFLLRQFFSIEDAGTIWGMSLPDVLGIVLVAVGGLILIADLGRPLRILNALRKPGRSWIARGGIADFAFIGLGILYVLPGLFPGLPWSDAVFADAGPGTRVLIVLMALMAVLIAVYPGLLFFESLAVPFWASALVPLLFFAYAIMSGMALMFALTSGAHALAWGLGLSLVASLLLTWLYLHTIVRNAPTAAKEARRRLTSGRWAWLFWLTIVVGQLVPLVLLLAGLSSTAAHWVIAVLVLAGAFCLRYVQLLAGLLKSPLG